MKQLLNYNFIALPLVAALALAVGCSKQKEPAGHAGHKGDSPGKAEIAATNPASGKKMCEEHGLPEDECGTCHPERATTVKARRRVQGAIAGGRFRGHRGRGDGGGDCRSDS